MLFKKKKMLDFFSLLFLSMKLNSKGVQSSSNRAKENETWKNTLINKERDKLLHEFLLAREELKAQFDCEKRELVGNYERRLRYLRRVLEDCDENINMLKLNLDAEKEENFILKTKIMEIENEEQNKKISEPKNHAGVNNVGYLNQSYDKESLVTSYPSTLNSSLQKQRRKSSTTTSTSAYQSYTTTPDKSSIDGLKYSDRMASCGSFGPESCFTSVSAISDDTGSVSQASHAGETNAVDLHMNCRSEFNRLLKELRVKQERFDAQLELEKERMREQIDNERIQLERVVYRQLNTRLDREIKKQDLLLTENAHLRRTISNAIMERMQCECRQPKKSNMVDSDVAVNHHNKLEWKESNSDSGADVRSDDDGSDSACDHDSGKGSMTHHDAMMTSPSSVNGDKIFQNGFIEQFIYNDFQQQYDNNNNNIKSQNNMKGVNNRHPFKESSSKQTSDINRVRNENEFLKEENEITVNCLREVEDFKHDLMERLVELEAVLTSHDDGEC